MPKPQIRSAEIDERHKRGQQDLPRKCIPALIRDQEIEREQQYREVVGKAVADSRSLQAGCVLGSNVRPQAYGDEEQPKERDGGGTRQRKEIVPGIDFLGELGHRWSPHVVPVE
jgi:hypothetical protein